YSRFHLII
ncbi:neurotransmitter symporter family protein, partial [Chlamydia psittaci 84-8471/1]